MADITHSQAVEAAKKWTRGGKEFTLKHGDTMASYLLSAPAPSCDAEWCRQFVETVFDEAFSIGVRHEPGSDWPVPNERFAAELASKFAARATVPADVEFKVAEEFINDCRSLLEDGLEGTWEYSHAQLRDKLCHILSAQRPATEAGDDDEPVTKPIGKCPKCGKNWYANEGFCGGCE